MNTQTIIDIPEEALTPVQTGTPEAPPPPPADPARMRTRHWGIVASFVIVVLLPVVASGWYLWNRAEDRYISNVAFSVRSADTSSALQIISGLGALGGASSSSDTDILYQFIQSQELVSAINDEINLKAMWSRGYQDRDPVFAFHTPATIEDLVNYWPRMVKVYNDSGTGIINVTVQAFTAKDAETIAQMIYKDSSKMINRLSAIAQEDATRYAREDRDDAVMRLKLAREALTRFRNKTQIVDPAASVQNQMGLLSSLQTQLAETLIEQAMLKDTVPDDDPRVVQGGRRVAVIKAQIAEEQKNLGLGVNNAGSQEAGVFADLVGEYERLSVDLQFAEQTYTAALAAYDGAAAESRRQTRYLAAHVRPTLAEASEAPQRLVLLGLVAMFAFFGWSIMLLIYYSVRDRR